MRVLSLLTAVICCTIFMYSCKKTKQTITKTTTITDTLYLPNPNDFTMLKPGNYWIYQTYQVNTDSARPAAGLVDSFYVEKDTAIAGKTYHKLVKRIRYMQDTSSYFLRDSLSYIVTNKGDIIYSSQDFTSVFDTVWYSNPLAGIIDTVPVTTQMGFKDSLMTVPIGVFQTMTFRKIFYFSAPAGTQDYDCTYAKNIGLIKQTVARYAYPGSDWFEDRLIRYHVE